MEKDMDLDFTMPYSRLCHYFDLTTAIGCITIPNEASILLHEKLGFEKVGEFKKVGYKFEAWHNVGYWQKHV